MPASAPPKTQANITALNWVGLMALPGRRLRRADRKSYINKRALTTARPPVGWSKPASRSYRFSTVTIPPSDLPAVPALAGPVMIPDAYVPERAGVTAIMSSVGRSGEWVLPRLFRVVAVMGDAVLDLSHVQLGAGVSEIEVVSVMANVTVIVPHNLRVQCEGHPIIGDFRLKSKVPSAALADAPLVRVRGTAFMAGVTVKVVDPLALGWRDRRRQRRLARQRADEELDG
jgi:hypothetical protein